jgi:hypothetical protein
VELKVKLETPLLPRQIEAADKLREYLVGWKLSDKALIALSEKFPGFESHVCLLKCVTINATYGTNVLAIVKMRKHVEDVLGRSDLSKVGPELVVQIAKAPEDEDGKSRRRTSFASKFCHFFVSAERFPIYDDAACNALKLHFGKKIKAHDYGSFCECIEELKVSVGSDYSTRTIDHYLWLMGMYLRWIKEQNKPNPIINSELLVLFKNSTSEQMAELDVLLPQNLARTFKT